MKKEKCAYHIFKDDERVAIVYACDAQVGIEGDLYFYDAEENGRGAELILSIPVFGFTHFDKLVRNCS